MKANFKTYATILILLVCPVLIVDQWGDWTIKDTVENVYYRGDGEWSEDRNGATVYKTIHEVDRAYWEAVSKSGYCSPYPFAVEEK